MTEKTLRKASRQDGYASAKTGRATKGRPRKDLPTPKSGPPTPAVSPARKPGRWAAQAQSVAGKVLSWAGTAAEMAVGATKPFIKNPPSRKALEAAGRFLRDARETAGISAEELAAAVDLEDIEVLAQAESGKAALPFEIILRIASLLSRNDPIPFAMQLTRGYSPSLWSTLEQIGIGRLIVHAGREHEFINIYRSRDKVRKLTDEEFARLLGFVSTSVDMTLGLIDELKASHRKS